VKTDLIAITGATGFIGKYLQTELKAAGHPVVGITRSGVDGTRAVGDLAEQPHWQECLQDVDTVVHCAAVAHKPLTDDTQEIEHLYRVNVKAVEALAEACLRSGVRRLVFLSSVKVYGESTSGRAAFRETDPLVPEDHYGHSKLQAEAILDDYANRGLQVCSLRLPLVYGPGAKGNFLKLEKLALSGLPLPLGSINNRRSLLSVQNLAKALNELLIVQHLPHLHMNVADPEPVSVPEIVRLITRRRGRKNRLFQVPIPLLYLITKLVSLRAIIERLAGDLEIDTSCLQNSLPALTLNTTQICLTPDKDRETETNAHPFA
jgi:UDP-glucose 4-epimerase